VAEPLTDEVLRKIDHASDLCRIGPCQAGRLLRRLAANGKIAPKGKGKETFYERRS
jgi:ATP-dependent DNA helicase RecG